MLKKRITYTDYDGVSRTEDFYFHINKYELTKMTYSHDGGLDKKLARITDAQDNKQILQEFEDLIRLSYGVKSDDGKRFVKSPELTEEFLQTNAFEVLFMELMGDPKAAANFVNAIIPSDLAEELKKNGDFGLPEGTV